MTSRVRAQSVDRMENRLVDILENVITSNRPIRTEPQFKVPQYEGKSDAEYFILWFQEVAEASGWGPMAAVLHPREALKDGAQECGQAANVYGSFEALRPQYATSSREARMKLNTLRKNTLRSLPEHAIEVKRLLGLVYAELPEDYKNRMAVETFCNTLGDVYLQRHILVVDTPTVDATVRA